MKKIITLLLFTLAALSLKINAQTTTCNADFSASFLTTFNVQFNPVIIGDSINTHHSWTFGDGGSSNIPAPIHLYASAGSYTVKHILTRYNLNGGIECHDTVTKIIVIQSYCNLTANFSWYRDSLNFLKIHFTNTTSGLSSTDSIRWTFGDGGTSLDVNPVHTYANYGTYTVCLRVKKNNSPPGTTPCVSEICKQVIVYQPCNLTANFTWVADSANSQKIWFTNTTVPLSNTDSIRWNFGDGTSSNLVNPDHTYSQPGTYTVCLRVQKRTTAGGLSTCVSEVCKTVIVHSPCNLSVNFTWHADSLNAHKIWFTNTSVPVNSTDSIRWNFGDGTYSNILNPDHTYSQSGSYNVCLVIQQRNAAGALTGCVKYTCHTVVVTEPCNLAAHFTWRADSINSKKIWFTNTSTGFVSTDSIRWTFGDGTSSNTINPDHIYSQAGSYTVCLRVQKRSTAGGLSNCVSETCQVVVVHDACNFTPDYSYHLDSINNRKVYFTNLTVVPNSSATATWFFGDGSSATSWNAVHEYAQAGRYYVCLRIQLTPTCVKYKCDSITILPQGPPCNNQSNFTAVKFSNDNQKYTFTPDYQNSAATYTWTFGDGTGSNSMIAIHRYDHPGTYTVCLTVWRSASCASTTCKTIIVTSSINCDSIHVYFTYQKDPFYPNKVYFYAISNFPILDETWTITKIPASGLPVILHQNNPIYVFHDTGYYQVCLRAITLGGCIKEYCSVIHIEHLGTTQCELQAYPNPATSQVSVNVTLTQPEMINVYVYNTLNVLVKEKHQQGNTGNNVVSVAIGDLTPGMYTMKVVYGTRTCYARFQKI